MFQFFFPGNRVSRLSTNVRSAIDYEDEWTANTETDDKMAFKLSRTSLLILDYKQFRAAQRIQKYWKRYHERQMSYQLDAAVSIQRWWRGFRQRRKYIQLVEEKLHQRLWEHFNRSATKIQAFYRGWFVRQTVHNAYSLRRMQLCAAEELLSCVAYKLHHLLRTYSIPGVYSLRNSKCLSKVEKMLTSTTFRFHNDRARYYQSQMANMTESRRAEFNANRAFTKVPYSGPNFNTLCKVPCDSSVFGSKYMDSRMYKIIEGYEKSQLDQKMQKMKHSLANRKFRLHVENILSQKVHTQRDFCGDVIESMRKWKIWDDQNVSISKSIFKSPELLSNFLDEAADFLKDFQNITCHCKIKVFDKLICK
ncbi:uncharacterized protein LOC117780712 [Drosophila innubila]|uniref:uncharacterized protein LOC117780712 n=1 Tax=Drosophila innubila TaxID=198719 RepID=UPI00148D02D2|nr:uncharacterized protein LOC117780712 [Drosophila innubila]